MAEDCGVVCVVGVAHNGGVLQYIMVCSALLVVKTTIERGPWYARLDDYVAVSEHHLCEYSACCKVEALGHTYAKMSRTLIVEFTNCCPKKFIVGVVIGAVACKGYDVW